MRVLMTVEMDTDASSRAVADGSLSKVMESTLSQLQPEAAYFTTREGHRTAYLVFDLQEPSQMVQIADPFFSTVSAKVDWSPVMNPQDLQKGLDRLPHR